MRGVSAVRVSGFDHVVLRVQDVERSLAWYTERLGLVGERVEEWRRGEVLFPSLRIDATALIDLLPVDGSQVPDDDRRNVDHFCLVVDPVDLEALRDSGDLDVVGGPARLYGARGDGWGLYVRDPDGNVVELRHYAEEHPPAQ
jgi:catechol 2,3-dioxygenase-like lactoylglutathione lyase family enzyme